MQKALATFRSGHVELMSPVDWPEGTAVEVIPLKQQIGIAEDRMTSSPAERSPAFRKSRASGPPELLNGYLLFGTVVARRKHPRRLTASA
jgi:hypothetical protein